jgi:hypothetical protein
MWGRCSGGGQVAINTDDNLIISQVLRGKIHGLHKALNIDITPQKHLL